MIGLSRYDVINDLIEVNQFKSFLGICSIPNITQAEVKCDYKKMVDGRHDIGNEKRVGSYYIGKSDDFFAQNTEKFDLIYISGFSLYYQARKDFENAIKSLNPNGLIVLCNSNPVLENIPTDDRWKIDSFKLIIDIWRGAYLFDYYTVNEDNGCTVINPHAIVERPIQSQTKWEHTYEFFRSSRERILNFAL